LRDLYGLDHLESLKIALGVYAILIAACALLYTRLSKGAEPKDPARPLAVTKESRGLLVKISALFLLDSLGGGFLTTSLLTYFFFTRFHASEGAIAVLFAGARFLNALSHLGASWLAKRIGLVRTMVLTHIHSSLLL